MTTSFQAVPVIDFHRIQNDKTRATALCELRDAVFGVGFLYLINTGIESLIKDAHAMMPGLFELPSKEKQKCHMRNSPCFLGYTGLCEETTAAKIDTREQFDFGTHCTPPPEDDDIIWRNLEGVGQYPNDDVEAFVKRYTTAMSELSLVFLHSVAECLTLPPDTFDKFIGNMSRLKMVKYPPAKPGSQGVGPHKDSLGLFTFLSQDSVGGLQVLNKQGQWINVSPIKGSLVVNIAQGFEAVTGGLCSATTHRVESPTNVTRYSVPFFQAIKLDLSLTELKSAAEEIKARIPAANDLKKKEVDVPSDLISADLPIIGAAQLRNRIMSHPEVGERYYPELFKKYTLESYPP